MGKGVTVGRAIHYAVVVVPEAYRDLLLGLSDPLNTSLPEYAYVYKVDNLEEGSPKIENLDPDITYCVRIWAYDSFGVGIPTQINSFQPISPRQ